MLKSDIAKVPSAFKINSTYAEDLGFELIREKIFSAKEDKPLYDFLTDAIKNAAATYDDAINRLAVFNDLIGKPELVEKLSMLLEAAMEEAIDRKAALAGNIKPDERLRYYSRVTCESIKYIEKLSELLNEYDLKAAPLISIKKVISDKKPFDELSEVCSEFEAFNSTNFLSAELHFAEGFHLSAAKVMSTNNTESAKNLVDSIKKVFRKRTVRSEDIYYAQNYIIGNQMDEFKTAAILSMCAQISEINREMQNFFRTFLHQINMMKPGIKIREFMDRYNLKSCEPVFLNDLTSGIESAGLYDLGMFCRIGISGEEKSIVENEISCKKGRLLVVTGPNQSGKTSFLRAAGVAQLLAQCGYHVPASSYVCPVYPAVFTHFPKPEAESEGFGKLKEELTRLKTALPTFRNGALILFNESFMTTTIREGTKIARDVMLSLGCTPSTVIFVTHLHDFAADIPNFNRQTDGSGFFAVSLRAETKLSNDGKKQVFTYKITEGDPQEKAWGYDLWDEN